MPVSNIPQSELKPCPFCGGAAEYERLGTARNACIIACTECGCRLETGEVWSCGHRWNARHEAALTAKD